MSASEKRLVFISAGDHHQVHPSLNAKDASFDILVCFYGDSPLVRQDLQRRGISVVAGNGSKFQNLRKSLELNPGLLAPYDAALVLDDDLSLTAEEVAGLFDFRQENDFWIVQPSFRWGSSLGAQYSRCNPLVQYRYTNFIEVNAPLFRADKLVQFMQIYDGCLVGWGIDFWYMNVFEDGIPHKFAICDEISTVNPFTRSGIGRREIDQLQSQDERRSSWERVRSKRNLKQIVRRTYPGPRRNLFETVRVVGRLILTEFSLILKDENARQSEWRYLKGAVKRILRDLTAGVTARILRPTVRTGRPARTLRLLARVWGNTAFRSSEQFMMVSLEACRSSTGAVLEVGAGLTTFSLSAAIGSDRTVVALEDDPVWARRLKRRFLFSGARNVELLTGWLDTWGADRHDRLTSRIPALFGAVIIRPYLLELWGWRNWLSDLLDGRLDGNTRILIDGVERPEARQLADRLADRFDRQVLIHSKVESTEKYASLVSHSVDGH